MNRRFGLAERGQACSPDPTGPTAFWASVGGQGGREGWSPDGSGASLLRSRMVSVANKQAGREVKRLVALAATRGLVVWVRRGVAGRIALSDTGPVASTEPLPHPFQPSLGEWPQRRAGGQCAGCLRGHV